MQEEGQVHIRKKPKIGEGALVNTFVVSSFMLLFLICISS